MNEENTVEVTTVREISDEQYFKIMEDMANMAREGADVADEAPNKTEA